MLVPHQLFTFTGGGSVIKECTYARVTVPMFQQSEPSPNSASAICQQELTSRTSYTFGEIDTCAPLKTDMTLFHSPLFV